MLGRRIWLSAPRRLIIELMRLSAASPAIRMVRRMNIELLVRARDASRVRPPWSSIFTKAIVIVADEMPVLRRTYVQYPWPHLYEYPSSIAAVTVGREPQGGPIALVGILWQVGHPIRRLINEPVRRIRHFRRTISLTRIPEPFRRLLWWLGSHLARQRANYLGTFAISVDSGIGSDIVDLRSPVTVVIDHGPIAPDGSVDVLLVFDHRVLDAAIAARVLRRIEQVLLGPVLEGLLGQGTASTSAQRF